MKNPLAHAIISPRLQKTKRIVMARFPIARILNNYVKALVSAKSRTAKSYAQSGEDLYAVEQLSQIDISHAIYIDIGANHPSKLSNTYLLYRSGISGIVIDPNRQFEWLYHRFRPRDIFIPIGCGKHPQLSEFIENSVDALSMFTCGHPQYLSTDGSRIVRRSYIPVLPLSMVMQSISIDYSFICLLSIDTEGLDVEVLEGAVDVLSRVFLVCIECTEVDKEAYICAVMYENRFNFMMRIGVNILFRNNTFLRIR